MLSWFKKKSEALKKRLGHPVVYALVLVIFCWSGITTLFHPITRSPWQTSLADWQIRTTFVVAGIGQLVVAASMGTNIWLWFKRRTRNEDEATKNETPAGE